MANVFFIGDTHFGHKNIIKYEPVARPFETIEAHDAEIIRRWNAKVTNKDTVWHLGDVLFGRHSFALLEQLNGNKKLVMGNHDHYPTELYMEHFDRVCGCAAFGGYILTHLPVHFTQNERFKGNIHGHLHSNKLETGFHHNVSCEQINLTPIAFEELT